MFCFIQLSELIWYDCSWEPRQLMLSKFNSKLIYLQLSCAQGGEAKKKKNNQQKTKKKFV